MQENLKAKGELKITLTKPNGDKEVHEVKNLIVDTGTAYIASRMNSTAESVLSHMAVGTDSTAAAAGNTTLGAESARVGFDTLGVLDNVLTYTATFAAGVATGALVEAGLFNDPSAGTMLCRTVFPVINKGVDDSLAIDWSVTISAS